MNLVPPSHSPDLTLASGTFPAGMRRAFVGAGHLNIRQFRTMRIRHLSALALLAAVFMAPLRVVALSPLANEVRPIHATADTRKLVTVVGGMVWYDGDPASHGIRFPPGVYVLEAEDTDYLYFRSSKPLELRVFANGKMVDGRDIPGGLMLSKHLISMIPAAGYIGATGSNKMMLWKLGANFLQLKGKSWTKSF